MIFDTAAEAYTQILNNNKHTHINFVIYNAKNNLFNVPERNLDYKQMIGLLFYHLQGKSDLESLVYYNKAYSNLSDDNETINGMWGNRIFSYEGLFDFYNNKQTNELQCEHIIVDQYQNAYEGLLQGNFYNIQLYNPVLDKHTNNACNVSNITFIKNNKSLDLTINVLYLDFYYQFPYLNFLMSNLLFIMSTRLNIEVGRIYYNIISLLNYKQVNLRAIKTTELDTKFYDTDIFAEIFDLELLSRVQGNLINKKHCKEVLNEIPNDYWKSITAIMLKLNTGLDDFDKFISPHASFVK